MASSSAGVKIKIRETDGEAAAGGPAEDEEGAPSALPSGASRNGGLDGGPDGGKALGACSGGDGGCTAFVLGRGEMGAGAIGSRERA
jgi:hypothetical protein